VAIDEVAALPLENGFRGAVLLESGTFTCAQTIRISTSGVVLRGSGSGARDGPKTTITLSGRPHTAIVLRAASGGRDQRSSDGAQPASDKSGGAGDEFKPASTTIVDDYVPSGATKFTVADAAGFDLGDTISDAALKVAARTGWERWAEDGNLGA